VVDLLTPGVRGQQKAIAQVLEVTPQAVSAAIVRSGYHDEFDARGGIARLLELAEQL
jgi:predicted transcriptional regulator